MPQETELKLSLQPHDLPRLLRHPLLTAHKPTRQRLLNTYFDTPDLVLMQQRVAVRERRVGRRTLLTVKTAGSSVGGLSTRGEWEGPTRPGAFDFAALVDDPALAQSLVAVAWRLVPLFRTDFVRHSWLLDFAGAQIEVALDQGAVSVGDSVEAPRTPHGTQSQPILELELELKEGSAQSLLDLAHRLALGPEGDAATGLWLQPFDRSKAECGLDLFLGRRVQPTKSEPVGLSADMHPAQAFQLAALSCLAHLQANVSGYLAVSASGEQPDPEFLHQARVALRRLRTGLSLFRTALPRRFAEHWRRRFQVIASALGDARNWDVLETSVLPHYSLDDPEGAQLAQWVQRRRLEANDRAAQVLRDPTYAIDLLAFTRAVLARQVPMQRQRGPGLAIWAQHTLRKQHERLIRRTEAALVLGAPGSHALRIELKQTRYALEFLSSLLPSARVRRATEQMRRGQELLGAHNDLHTALTLLGHCELLIAPQLARELQLAMKQVSQKLPAMERRLLRARTPWD